MGAGIRSGELLPTGFHGPLRAIQGSQRFSAGVMKHHVTIIGAGKAGSAVARALKKSGATIDAVISPNKSHAKSLAKELHCTLASTSLADIARSTTLLILSVPDNKIA